MKLAHGQGHVVMKEEEKSPSPSGNPLWWTMDQPISWSPPPHFVPFFQTAPQKSSFPSRREWMIAMINSALESLEKDEVDPEAERQNDDCSCSRKASRPRKKPKNEHREMQTSPTGPLG